VLPSGGPGDGAEGRGARLVRLPQLNRSPFHGDAARDPRRPRLSWCGVSAVGADFVRLTDEMRGG
jgi:hypothetical protein